MSVAPERIPANLPALRLPQRWHTCNIHILMIRAVYVDQHVFRVSIKLIEGRIHRRVVGEAFELIDLRLETIAPGFP